MITRSRLVPSLRRVRQRRSTRLLFLSYSVLVVAAAAGWPPRVHGRIVLALCLSTFATVGIRGALKIGFGRTWPESWLGDNPSWVRDRVFDFFPFHGGRGWGILSVRPYQLAWQAWRRSAWATMIGCRCQSANYHFTSEMTAGFLLGARHWVWNYQTDVDQKERLNWSIMVNRYSTRRDERAECRSA